MGVRMLDNIMVNRRYPMKMWIDTSLKLISLALAQSVEEHGVMLEFIKLGKPT